MPKVAAFHSKKPGDKNVHHDNSACTEGNNIEARFKATGTDNRPRCEHCTRLAQQGK